LLKKLFFITGILSLVFTSALLGGCTQSNQSKLKVVTGTSLVADIVREIGGSHVDVINLVPPSQHPGNFDVKPSDIQNLSTAKLLLIQGLPGETYIDQLVASANNPNLQVVKANVPGNWMIPSVQSAAVDSILNTLILVDPGNTADYQAAAASYKNSILTKEADIQNKLTSANVGSIKVITSSRQADFLQWAGFTVVATFNDASSLTPQVLADLTDKGKVEGVKLVVNNLQDSTDAGKGLASSIGAKNINLSNFPGGYNGTDTWAKAIDYNVNLLINAIK
jgi:zinc transport system substrate-binding protein